MKYWMRDKVFAEQRLAGVNPMTLMRVTTDRGKLRPGSTAVLDFNYFKEDKETSSLLTYDTFAHGIIVKISVCNMSFISLQTMLVSNGLTSRKH